MIDSALELAAQGWAVFPLRPKAKVPATEHGCKDATTDTERIERWWKRHPSCNVAVATGSASGIWVLDVDGPEGARSLEGFGHEMPATTVQTTPSGGKHFVFAWLPGLGNSSRKLGPGLDTRGEGGYIVVPDSVTDIGGYAWASRWRPAQIPGWLLRLCRPAEPEPVARPVSVPSAAPASPDNYVAAAVRAEVEGLACMAPRTGRNEALNKAAFSLGGFVASSLLSSEAVYDRLLEACGRNGLLAEDGQRSCRNTIASGLSAGIAHPRQVS